MSLQGWRDTDGIMWKVTGRDVRYVNGLDLGGDLDDQAWRDLLDDWQKYLL